MKTCYTNLCAIEYNFGEEENELLDDQDKDVTAAEDPLSG